MLATLFLFSRRLLTSEVMQKNTLLFVIIAALGGFIAGFILANSINRNAVSVSPQTTAPSNSNTASGRQSSGEQELSPDEIRAKVAEADKNPTVFSFQKDLGIALYRYAAMKQDVSILTESARILERADSINPKDFDVVVALGNATFDIGFFKEDAASFQKAREVYARALAIKPGDADVMTDLGISYYVQKPPAYDKAVVELLKVSDANPKHERSLQFLIQTYVKQNKIAEAEKSLAKLKGINPTSGAIAEMTSMITAAKGGSSK